MPGVRYPSLFQINTRVRLRELSRELGRPATLDDFPDSELDELASLGFDWVWFLGVWQTGPAAQKVSLTHPGWRQEFKQLLPDLVDSDIAGSCFAVVDYTVHSNLGGNAGLAHLRQRLQKRGLRLMLDFVPNHTAPDHPWVTKNPDFYVNGTEFNLVREPHNYCKVKTPMGSRVMAYGRDPFFPGWPDTFQLNYGNPRVQEAMIGELLKVASMCDGVRCDMAMLILPGVFERTWGIKAESFWPKAIWRVREKVPDFFFMAEVYWDLEWELQQQGFNYCYDKRLYDRLKEGHARPVREHFFAGLDFQDKLARFPENHDEPRAAAVFPPQAHEVAAVLTFLSPGLRFFHQGQFNGHTKKISIHLVRGPAEPTNKHLEEFYRRLLNCLKDPVFRQGDWRLLQCLPAWEGNWTWDCFIAFAFQGPTGQERLIVVNYAPNNSQCYVPLSFPDLPGTTLRLKDLMSHATYDRHGSQLVSPGLYLDMPPWAYHVFELNKLK